VAFLGPVGVLFVLIPTALVSFFATDPAVVGFAVDCLRIVAVGFVVFAFGMVTVQAFNGAGDTTTPMLINVASFWLFKVPCALVLAKVVGLGPRGAFLAITAAYAVQSVAAGLMFRRGGWEKRRV
jgi:Na+-driven multidrug efflux pump